MARLWPLAIHSYATPGQAGTRLPKRPKEMEALEEHGARGTTRLSAYDAHLSRTETELVESVQMPPLIGIDWRVDQIMASEIGMGLDDVRFIQILGYPGVGRTTLARALYERLHHQFDFHCFLPNVGEVSKRKNGLLHLQIKLLSHLKMTHREIEDTHQGKSTLQYVFQNRKVMLILDDVDDISQLENLAGSQDWFGAGSRIFFISRLFADLDLENSRRYEVPPMKNDEALQLFRQKEFSGENLQQLAQSAVFDAKGLPLILCVMGFSFCGRHGLTETEWVNDWKDALHMLNLLLQSPRVHEFFHPLRLSFMELSITEKEIFLDIACFFNMWGKDEIIQILESCGLPARRVLHKLWEKSMIAEIEIDNATYIEMHELLQETGRRIVMDEKYCYDVGTCSRLWHWWDINKILTNSDDYDMETLETEGVVLPHGSHIDKVDWKVLLNMPRLRLLVISCDSDSCPHLKGLPRSLKVLHWNRYPFEALPSDEPLDDLVYLKMQYSQIKFFNNHSQGMYKLEILDLSLSSSLHYLNFSRLVNLRRLVLEGCISLIEIDSSLGQLQHIIEINLKGCFNLKVLPRKLENNSLEELVLCGCTEIKNLPEFGTKMENLKTLDVKWTSITELPESLGLLTSIETLDLKGCKKLVGLPENIQKLKCLKVLDVSGCSSFSELPKNLNENEALEKLDTSGTPIGEVPSAICHLKKLKKLSFHGCKQPISNSSWNRMSQTHSFAIGLTLPHSIFNIESLTELDLSYCNIVEGFIPNDISGLSSLQKLDLSGNEFSHLPDGCISNLLNLQSLYLNSCPQLQFLPQPSPGLRLMDAGECGSLKPLSDKKLLNLFASIEQDGQHDGEGLSRMITNLSVTIPGSKIPSWFENQNDLLLNQKRVASVTIDIPKGDWLGIGLCIVIDDRICLPHWGFDFKAPNGLYESIPGRTRENEKEIKSHHLWTVFWKIKEENRDELLRNYSQIRLKFTDWGHPSSTLVDVESMKCGWHFIYKGDLESLNDDGENTMSSEEEEKEHNETSQTTIRECEETVPSETSALRR